jgi:hypothetical protein
MNGSELEALLDALLLMKNFREMDENLFGIYCTILG